MRRCRIDKGGGGVGSGDGEGGGGDGAPQLVLLASLPSIETEFNATGSMRVVETIIPEDGS